MQFFTILVQLLGGLTLIPWLMATDLSILLIEKKKSVLSISPWLLIAIFLSYPFLLGLSFWKAWLLFDDNVWSALFLSMTPSLLFALAYGYYITRFYANISREQ